MTSTRPSVLAPVPFLLGAVLLSACSSAASSAPSAAVASAQARASAIASAMHSGSAAPVASGPITKGDQLCALVSVAEAAAATRTTPPITAQEGSLFVDNEPICGFNSADGMVVITVLWGDAKDDPYHPPKPTLGSGATATVDGLGYPAAANDSEIDVKVGDHTLVVTSPTDEKDPRDVVIGLAKLFVAKL